MTNPYQTRSDRSDWYGPFQTPFDTPSQDYPPTGTFSKVEARSLGAPRGRAERESARLRAQLAKVTSDKEALRLERDAAVLALARSSSVVACLTEEELSRVADHVPLAFQEAFGATPASICVRTLAEADEDGCVQEVVIDARGLDTIVQERRAAGARYDFYRLLFEAIPDIAIDGVRFEFVFDE